ncbi:uncharacterized protein PG986_006572 [Apiospora aurea]|uniref:Uncharacterized protein n=1 Tax=Apiospora aurea TaxID=335848 RepID=A0ABR1QKT8_9PEZI
MVFFGLQDRRICGFHYQHGQNPTYLPQVKVEAHTSIISSIARTTLVQTFVNPATHAIPQLYYTFPLFDGVSIVDFTCTVGDRVIKGVVKEKAQAKATFDHAVAQGQTAGLLEQAVDTAGDVFKTSVGNVPGGAQIKVEISCLGELKHDAQNNGLRLTIPTTIAPRYGSYPGSLQTPRAASATTGGGMKITVDAQVSSGSRITSIQSPSHQIAVTIGRTAELDKDFVLQMTATEFGNPVAILEEHPSIPDQKAIMATLVPKFELAPEKPEVVFVCDRSGSMSDKIIDLKKALQLFVKSLTVGVKFNICSFGSRHSFLWNRSRTYDSASMAEAMQHIESFSANYGGTEMYAPIEQTITRRYQDMNLEVFLLTDGEIWDQDRLVQLINESVFASNGAIRFFTLGIGPSVSHSLIERVARAGNGFSQAIGNSEEMGSKVVRMLKGAMFPHIKDCTMEVKYEADQDEDFEVIETLKESLVIQIPETKENQEETAAPKNPISLFDPSVNDAAPVLVTSGINTGAVEKFSAIPPISIPKLLQAPHLIPPLFPFTRSTIYLLLSSETRTPKSVVLRGTSRQGPLELEIPVSRLGEKGKNIHQLAAKKAVGELEEGRGWIFHAKDSNGVLLKQRYEGRFPDMVEREAVRLGVAYQVGGKWCSFVAAPEGEEGDGESDKEPFVPMQQQQMSMPQHSFVRSSSFRAGPYSGPLPSMRSAMPSSSGFGAQDRPAAYAAPAYGGHSSGVDLLCRNVGSSSRAKMPHSLGPTKPPFSQGGLFGGIRDSSVHSPPYHGAPPSGLFGGLLPAKCSNIV